MSRSLRTVLNESNPNKISDAMKAVRVGDALAVLPRRIAAAVVAHVLVLPEDAKAAVILQCLVTAGGVTGRFTAVSADATPATTECGVNAAGNIQFLAADAVTLAEVVYVPMEGGVVEDLLPVAADVGTFLQSRKAQQLLAVTATAGGAPGVKTLVTLRGATPAAGSCAINLLGTGVVFAAADAITACTARYVAQPGVGGAPGPIGSVLDAQQSSL